jgi:DNA-binding MarR family transcriptional regulator
MQHRSLQQFRPYGITPQQYNILRILRGSAPQPCSVRMLTERMLDKNSNASRLVDKLLEKALVERKECPNDRRQVEVTITQKGLKLLVELDAFVNSQDNILGDISTEEANRFSEILDQMRLRAGAKE